MSAIEINTTKYSYNKVISNGRSKIKNLKDEMIKLNNRMPYSSSANSVKRISIVGPSKSLSSIEGIQQATPSSSTSRNLSAKSNESIATSSVVIGTPAARSSPATVRQPIVNDRQAPEIKPRTSILKNRQQKQSNQFTISNSSDINNNNCSQQRKLEADQSVARARLPTSKCEQNAKPKSILKSPKSVSNTTPSGQTAERLDKGKTSPELADRQNLARTNLNLRSMRRVLPTSQSVNISKIDHKRRSCALLVRDKNDSNEPSRNEDVDREALVREQSFERLRMRASCYDISRLMSKNGLQNQLSKLRADPTSSIAIKSRQRRPALLIDNSNTSSALPPPTSLKSNDDDIRGNVTLDHQQRDPESLAPESAQQQSKRSEFDQRSLKRIPPTGSKQSVAVKSQVNVADQDKAERRKSVAMIKFTGSCDENVVHKEKLELEEEDIDCVLDDDDDDHDDAKETRETLARTKSDENQVDNESSHAEVEEETECKQSNALSKSGPFNLLRQSFSQKSLSSMLKFSSRASMRFKGSTQETTGSKGLQVNSTNESNAATESDAKSDKATAIAIAEANLLAAKQLKQQAQKLKEQQKRESQQQAAMLDPTSVMLAVQYNQQVQRQQHQQQQQILYQQYAIAARGQMFDPSAMHLQHAQMIMQRQQQQQQLANYMAGLNNQAHYMAQQMAAAAAMQHPAGAVMATHHHHHQQQLMYSAVPGTISMQQTPPHNATGIYRKSILKSTSGVQSNAGCLEQQAYPGQGAHLIPMSVNHHSSSFNIVYSAPPTQLVEQPPTPQPALSKHSSLGASMRKTVKSILVNRSSFLSSSTGSQTAKTTQAGIIAKEHQATAEKQEVKALKSALKVSQSRPLILNSEGSDSCDGSSSDSTTTATTSSVDNNNQDHDSPKSVLKKSGLHHHQMVGGEDDDDNLSSDSSNEADYARHHQHKSNTLTQASVNELRQRLKGKPLGSNPNYSTLRASKRKSIAACSSSSNSTTGRKNVTFSTKLTSIL